MGIINAMDPSGTWAGEALAPQEVQARKGLAKLQLQAQLGLEVGEQYQLAVFVGRLTLQKGVDIIAAVSAMRAWVRLACFAECCMGYEGCSSSDH